MSPGSLWNVEVSLAFALHGYAQWPSLLCSDLEYRRERRSALNHPYHVLIPIKISNNHDKATMCTDRTDTSVESPGQLLKGLAAKSSSTSVNRFTNKPAESIKIPFPWPIAIGRTSLTGRSCPYASRETKSHKDHRFYIVQLPASQSSLCGRSVTSFEEIAIAKLEVTTFLAHIRRSCPCNGLCTHRPCPMNFRLLLKLIFLNFRQTVTKYIQEHEDIHTTPFPEVELVVLSGQLGRVARELHDLFPQFCETWWEVSQLKYSSWTQSYMIIEKDHCQVVRIRTSEYPWVGGICCKMVGKPSNDTFEFTWEERIPPSFLRPDNARQPVSKGSYSWKAEGRQLYSSWGSDGQMAWSIVEQT